MLENKELDLFKDYVLLDDSYFEFDELIDQKGYSIRLKENLDFKEEIKIFIPSMHDGIPVKMVGSDCFSYEKVIGIYIPDSIEHIESLSCDSKIYYKELYIGGSAIIDDTFLSSNDENRLERILVSKENKTYDSRNNCNAIIETYKDALILGCNNTIIPKDIKVIDLFAFSGCLKMYTIDIPNSVEKIQLQAFNNCPLKEIYISENVSYIENIGTSHPNLFKEIEKIEVSTNNKFYDSKENCNAIIATKYNYLIRGCKNTIIPKSVKKIGSFAFSDLDNIKEIIIPDNIEKVLYGAFSGLKNAKKVFIGKNVKEINNCAFDLTNLNEIKVSDENKFYDSRNNCNAVIDSISNNLIIGCSKTVIPKTVKIIDRNAFLHCAELKSIEIPENVIIINDHAFEFCFNLESIKLPQNIIIKELVFCGCKNLKSIYIPKDSCVFEYAFNRCEKLESIYDLDNAKFLENNAFIGCNVRLVSLNKKLDTFISHYIFNNFEDLEMVIYKGKKFKRKDLIRDKDFCNYWYFDNERLVLRKN